MALHVFQLHFHQLKWIVQPIYKAIHWCLLVNKIFNFPALLLCYCLFLFIILVLTHSLQRV